MRAVRAAAWAALGLLLGGCMQPPVLVEDRGPNAVALWDGLAAAAVLQPAAASGTPEERRPMPALDMATLHLAIHDAVRAAPAPSQEAAAHAAGLAVMQALYPARSAEAQAAYTRAVAALPADDWRDTGLRIGAERAAVVIARRAGDGRWADVPPAVPGTAPGAFRGVRPIEQTLPHVRPFMLDSASQFRSAAPPALDSAAWRTDVEETRRRGGAGTAVSAREEEDARFHTEPPWRFWTRNLGRHAVSQRTLAGNARLMALLWVSQADAAIACFDAKYRHYRGRPVSVIEPPWTPRVPTPNHPEYPAGHGCASAAYAQNLADFHGTRHVRHRIDSTVTGTVHLFDTADGLVDEVREARIVGGMHFRHSMLAGERLGRDVAREVARRLQAGP